MRHIRLLLAGLVVSFSLACSGQTPAAPDGVGLPPIAACAVDTHQHFSSREPFDDGARALLAGMDERSVGLGGIALALVMPPPIADPATAGPGTVFYTYLDSSPAGGPTFLDTVRARSDRLALVAGGGVLGSWIHASALSGVEPPTEELASFEHAAELILEDGAVGFGEIAVLHLSVAPTHPFIHVPPDHPLLLLLAGIAARRGVPIDIHHEIVDRPSFRIPEDLPRNADGMPCFRSTATGGLNPPVLEGTRDAFERLLSHADATIVWTHVGWDNLGDMDVTLLRELLAAHSNLVLSLKMLDDPSHGCQVAANRPLDPADGSLRPEWARLFEDYPDRFVLGGDEFFGEGDAIGSPSTGGTWSLLSMLSPALARRFACENPRRIFHLGE